MLTSFIVILTTIWLVEIVDGRNPGGRSTISESQQIVNEFDSKLTESEAMVKESVIVADAASKTDSSSWTPYQNSWYGFSLKYPNEWADPVVRKASAGALWEQKVQFRVKNAEENNPFEGFDLSIYSIAKTKNLQDTEEFPKLQSEEMKNDEACHSVFGHLLETGDYPAEEIYVPINDACFSSALFFTNTRDSYIYNLSPKIKDGWGLAGDPAKEIMSHMPEFFAIASTFELIDIQRPRLAAVKPKITAPMPASYKVVDGKLVCEKNKDKPSKSKKNKGRHLDMECCLDPDEYPNPWCYYDPAKYGKYLK